jgi:hypothetical protein
VSIVVSNWNGRKAGEQMQVVINIDEEIYEALKNGEVMISGLRSGKTFMSKIFTAVANGTPLPKGHGRLIDADAINLKDISPVDGFSVYGATAEDIDLTPTIIEVDRSED